MKDDFPVSCRARSFRRAAPRRRALLAASVLFALGCQSASQAPPRVATTKVGAFEARIPDPLASWNDGAAKRAIVDFVTRVTREGSAEFVPVAERIATFDNDGTLWSEQPVPVQLAFALDRVQALAPQHPEWARSEPFRGILAGNHDALRASGERGVLSLLAATHTGNTTAEFETIVSEWIRTARDPRFGRPYTALVYQPMLEVLAYFRAHGFKTYIVSGGGADFMRPWAERVYGIPPEQVIGSRAKTKYEVRDGTPVLLRLPEVDLINDGPGKPVGIQQLIGRRPIAAFGNSDGDFEMLEWTSAGRGERLSVLIHHTDAAREYAYDQKAPVGALVRGLEEADKRGWLLVDMQKDWRAVYPFEKRAAEPSAHR